MAQTQIGGCASGTSVVKSRAGGAESYSGAGYYNNSVQIRIELETSGEGWPCSRIVNRDITSSRYILTVSCERLEISPFIWSGVRCFSKIDVCIMK